MHTWRTSHYVLRTNVDALLAERILLTMEMMHSAYNRLYTPPASLGQQTPELLLALGGRHHQTSEGEVYRMPAGQQVVRYRESKLRLVIHTDGKRVLLKPDRTRRIHFPWGRVVNGWPRSQALHKTSIRLFWRRKGYRQYAKTTDPKWPFLQDAGGYFSPTRQEIVTYSKPSRSNLLQTLAHEAQHQVLSTHIKRAPVWLNEGLSEYYEQSSYTRGQLSHDVHLAHLNYVARLIREKSNTPLSKLVQLNYNQFHNDSFGPAEIGHYALSWSLVYFLLTAEEGRYRGLFARLFRALKDGALAREAVPHYLKAAGLDWDHLQMRWADYISRLAHENSVKKKPRPQGEK